MIFSNDLIIGTYNQCDYTIGIMTHPLKKKKGEKIGVGCIR